MNINVGYTFNICESWIYREDMQISERFVFWSWSNSILDYCCLLAQRYMYGVLSTLCTMQHICSMSQKLQWIVSHLLCARTMMGGRYGKFCGLFLLLCIWMSLLLSAFSWFRGINRLWQDAFLSCLTIVFLRCQLRCRLKGFAWFLS